MTLTEAAFYRIFPKLVGGHKAPVYLPHLNDAAMRFEITTPRRLACWLAQIAHETAGLTRFEESFSYSPARLREVFPRRVVDEIEAERIIARGPEAVAEVVYGLRKDLGNLNPGDGYKFRGRGPAQLTGFLNYQLHGLRLKLPLVGEPDLAARPEHGFVIAGDFWAARSLGRVADTQSVDAVSRVWNGGENGLKDRRDWLARIENVLASEAA